MRTASSPYKPGLKRGFNATKDTVQAYRAVFGGHGSKEETELVLADLANFSGFYQVTTPADGPEAVRYSEGQRSVFARILRFMRMSSAELAALEAAARAERLTDENEGRSI